MKLVPNWRAVLRYAWSVRLMLLAGLLSGIEAVLPLVGGLLPIPPRTFALLTFFAVVAAVYARFVVQKGLSDEK
ncbi:hypothetical protein [Candidatus Phyllobacterium onerii]|uniref:DUF7940 domain-containing protein n=1 Tax=Candidatus Phyllobacterium onerii TaxID=3020828 RepID=UPI002330A69C|nr:hypothetical protein [Phyllobacterium sp. IY22]